MTDEYPTRRELTMNPNRPLTPLEKAVVRTRVSDRLTCSDLDTIIEHAPDMYPADTAHAERERCQRGQVRYADLPQKLRDVYDRIPPHVRTGWEAAR